MTSKNNSGKKYPLKHARPKGRIIERGPDQFQVWLYSHTDVKGKPVRYTKTFKTLAEADAHLAEKVTQKNRGLLRVDANLRLSELLDVYMKETAPQRMRKHTLAVRQKYMQLYVLPTLGHKRVGQLTYTDFQSLYQRLLSTTSEKTGRKLAPGTIRVAHNTLRAVFAFYVKTGELHRNPVAGATVANKRVSDPRPLSKNQIPQFLEALERIKERHARHAAHRVGPVFNLAFETGMRPEEYIGLTLDDIALEGDAPHITVRRVAVRHPQVKGEWWFDEPKTQKSRRRIPITRHLARLLAAHILYTEQRKRKVKNWVENRLLFPCANGEPLYTYKLRHVFKEVISEMGLDPSKYRLYDIRHTTATVALVENVHPKVIAERLGHSSVTQTLDTYSHVVPTIQEDATEQLGKIIYPEAEPQTQQTPDVDITDYERPF